MKTAEEIIYLNDLLFTLDLDIRQRVIIAMEEYASQFKESIELQVKFNDDLLMTVRELQASERIKDEIIEAQNDLLTMIGFGMGLPLPPNMVEERYNLAKKIAELKAKLT